MGGWGSMSNPSKRGFPPSPFFFVGLGEVGGSWFVFFFSFFSTQDSNSSLSNLKFHNISFFKTPGGMGGVN